MKNIREFLNSFGLSEIEVDIYLGLLETGPVSVLELSKHIDQKRTTTHVNVESLIEKGLVVQTKKDNRRKVFAENPQKLKQILDNRRKTLDDLESLFPDVVSQINSISKLDKKSDIQIKYYEGKESVRNIYMDVIKAKELYSFVNIEKVLSVFPENSKIFSEILEERDDIRIWEIIEDSEVSRKYTKSINKKYQYKFMNENYTFADTDIMIFDNKVAFVNLDPNNITGIMIEAETISKSLKSLHQFMWKSLPEIKQ